MFTALGRTRYGDATSDFRLEFATEAEARAHLVALGFISFERHWGMICFHLAAQDDRGRAVQLAGYLCRPN
jgi:hypothetical protein